MHQDVLAEVLGGGEAEVGEGGAKGQGAGQLQQDEVIVTAMLTETLVDVERPHSNECLSIAWKKKRLVRLLF